MDLKLATMNPLGEKGSAPQTLDIAALRSLQQRGAVARPPNVREEPPGSWPLPDRARPSRNRLGSCQCGSFHGLGLGRHPSFAPHKSKEKPAVKEEQCGHPTRRWRKKRPGARTSARHLDGGQGQGDEGQGLFRRKGGRDEQEPRQNARGGQEHLGMPSLSPKLKKPKRGSQRKSGGVIDHFWGVKLATGVVCL